MDVRSDSSQAHDDERSGEGLTGEQRRREPIAESDSAMGGEDGDEGMLPPSRPESAGSPIIQAVFFDYQGVSRRAYDELIEGGRSL